MRAMVRMPASSIAAATPIRLHGLWLPQADPDAPVLLYLHGARYDVRSSAHRIRRMHHFIGTRH